MVAAVEEVLQHPPGNLRGLQIMGVRKRMEGTCRDVTLWRLTVHGVVSGVTKWLMPLFYISGTLFLSASLHGRRHGVTSLQVPSIIFRTLVICNPFALQNVLHRNSRFSPFSGVFSPFLAGKDCKTITRKPPSRPREGLMAFLE